MSARMPSSGGSSRAASGVAFPTTPAEGDQFYRTDLSCLFLYTGGCWSVLKGDALTLYVVAVGAMDGATPIPAGDDLNDGLDATHPLLTVGKALVVAGAVAHPTFRVAGPLAGFPIYIGARIPSYDAVTVFGVGTNAALDCASVDATGIVTFQDFSILTNAGISTRVLDFLRMTVTGLTARNAEMVWLDTCHFMPGIYHSNRLIGCGLDYVSANTFLASATFPGLELTGCTGNRGVASAAWSDGTNIFDGGGVGVGLYVTGGTALSVRDKFQNCTQGIKAEFAYVHGVAGCTFVNNVVDYANDATTVNGVVD
jgi:hypothetical protein